MGTQIEFGWESEDDGFDGVRVDTGTSSTLVLINESTRTCPSLF